MMSLADLPRCLTALIASHLDLDDVLALEQAFEQTVSGRAAVAATPTPHKTLPHKTRLLSDVLFARWRDAWSLARLPPAAGEAGVADAYAIALASSWRAMATAEAGTQKEGEAGAGRAAPAQGVRRTPLRPPPAAAVAIALRTVAADDKTLRQSARRVLEADAGPEPPIIARSWRVR